MAQANGIVVWTEGIKAELAKRLPRQRKTQQDKLAVLVATMLHVRSANLGELAAGALTSSGAHPADPRSDQGLRSPPDPDAERALGRPSTSSGVLCRWPGGSRKPRAPSAAPRKRGARGRRRLAAHRSGGGSAR